MAKVRSSFKNEVRWDKHRTFYDTASTDKKGHSTPVTVRFKDEDIALLQAVVDSKLSPEIKNVTDVIRGFVIKHYHMVWLEEMELPESSHHAIVKKFLQHMDEADTKEMIRRTIIAKVETAVKRCTYDRAIKLVIGVLRELNDEVKQWILSDYKDIENKKVRKLFEDLSEHDWLEKEYCKK